MVDCDSKTFNKFVSESIDNIPLKYAKHIDNLAFVVEEQPTEEQRRKFKLRGSQTLFGLYEGVPLTRRGSGYSLVLPDKITLFSKPLMQASGNLKELKDNVANTVWHEVAHYYGLGHDQIDKILEDNN